MIKVIEMRKWRNSYCVDRYSEINFQINFFFLVSDLIFLGKAKQSLY